MLLRISGVEVWITGGDKVPIKEHAVEIDEEDGVATCWITGEPGQPFAIRWRDISDPIACPIIDGYYSDPYVVQRDLSGFVMMDSYELGGRVLHARSHSPAIFSRIATSPTLCNTSCSVLSSLTRVPPPISYKDIDDAHRGHVHAHPDLGGPGQREVGWGDCCGIPVPSVFGAAKAEAQRHSEVAKLSGPGIRPVPFD